MSWLIEGTRENLHIGLTKNGHSEIWGEAIRHQLQPSIVIDRVADFYSKLQAANCTWSICATSDRQTNNVLREKAQNENRGIAAITFRDDKLTMKIITPPDFIAPLLLLFRTVLLSPKLEYLIELDFIGFKIHPSDTGIPSIEDFRSGDPYFAQVSFAIQPVQNWDTID